MSDARDLRRKIDCLIGEVGYKEGARNDNKFARELISWGKRGIDNFEPWCDQFQSWGTVKAGLEDQFPISQFCPADISWFKGKGWWSDYPSIGAQVYYGLAGGPYGAGGDHVETVIKFDGTRIWTVGGNTNNNGSSNGDGVYIRGDDPRPILRRDARVYGYGTPPVVQGAGLSADPRWGGRTSASYTELPSGAVEKPAEKPPEQPAQPPAARKELDMSFESYDIPKGFESTICRPIPRVWDGDPDIPVGRVWISLSADFGDVALRLALFQPGRGWRILDRVEVPRDGDAVRIDPWVGESKLSVYRVKYNDADDGQAAAGVMITAVGR